MFNAGVFITRQDGVPAADIARRANRLGRVAERDYMIAAAGGTSLGGRKPVLGKAPARRCFFHGSPIRDAQGKPVGAVVGVIDQPPQLLGEGDECRLWRNGRLLRGVVAAPHQRHLQRQEADYAVPCLP